LFTTICTDAEINLSTAQYRALFSISGNKVFLKQKVLTEDDDIRFISKWISDYFEAIPLGRSSRYLSTFHKRFLSQFSETIFSLLATPNGWASLIGTSSESSLKLRRLNEFYRQEGRWLDWIRLCDKIETFIDKSSTEYIELLRTKVWVYFWTRRYDDAKKLISKHPEIDEKTGQYSYWARISYMNNSKIRHLISQLEGRKRLDYFNRSLLGRSYARLALKAKSHSKKKELLNLAVKNLTIALKGAWKKNDMIEVAVQSWYLSVTYADLDKPKDSAKHFSEVKRLDESIMNRVPGKAWLRLAEYRIYLKQENIEEHRKERLKRIAVNAMKNLGMLNPEEYVESEYYY